MKAQTEVLNLTLFFLIAVILLFSVFVWGNSVISSNSDEANLIVSEQFMRNLDAKIRSVVKNGGSEILQTSRFTSLRMAENNTIEYIIKSNLVMPDYWIYIYGDDAAEVNASEYVSVLREKKESDKVRLQLYYRNRTGATKFRIVPSIYYEGSGRNIIKIEGNSTPVAGNVVESRIKLSVG